MNQEEILFFLKKNIFLFFLPPFILFSIFPVHGNQCPSARVTDFRAKTTPALPWKVPLLDVCVRGRVDSRDTRVGGGCVSWFTSTKKVPQTEHAPTHVRHTGSDRHSAHHIMRSCHLSVCYPSGLTVLSCTPQTMDDMVLILKKRIL